MVTGYIGQTAMAGYTGLTDGPGYDFQGAQGPIGVQGVIGEGVECQKLELKTGDILVVHYPEQIPQSELHSLCQSLKRVNDRLKEMGINLTDIVLFKEGVKVSVLSPNIEEKPSNNYRRIELSE